MWKDFFYYSKSERRVIALLLILIAILVAANFYTRWKEGDRQNADIIPNAVKEDAATPETKETTVPTLHHNQEGTAGSSVQTKTENATPSFFDPNTATREELLRQGLSPFVANNIIRYREKGGKFRTPESLSRIYGLDRQTFESVLPRITIGDAYKQLQHKPRVQYKKIEKLAPGTVINLNTADTTTLKRIPGIGSVYARRIVNYRTRLGGYHHTGQLQEVSGIDTTLNQWFEVGNVPVEQIPVNTASLDELKRHPYMNWQKAKAIVDYRKRYGRIKDISAFELFECFTSEDIEKLQPYMSF